MGSLAVPVPLMGKILREKRVKEEWHREAWAKAEKVIHALLILHQAVLQFWQIYMGVG